MANDEAHRLLIANLVSNNVNRDWGITNKLVEALGHRLAPSTFKGLLRANQLQQWTIPPPPFSIIVNTTNHFVAIAVRPTYILYFDSYGLACLLPEVCRFLRRIKTTLPAARLLHNRSRLQTITSQHCGLFALCLVVHHEDLDKAEPLPFVNRASSLNDKRSVAYIVKALDRSPF